jgi:hypothetical protein
MAAGDASEGSREAEEACAEASPGAFLRGCNVSLYFGETRECRVGH